MKKLLLFLFLFYTSFTFAQVYSSKNFIKAPYPVTGKDFEILRSRANDIEVNIIKGKLQLSRFNPKVQEYAFLKGYFLPLDLGEWGGTTYYRPNDTSQKTFYVNGKVDSVRAPPLTLWYRSFFKNDLKRSMDRYKNSADIHLGPITSMFKFKDSLYFACYNIYSLDLNGNKFITKEVLHLKQEGVGVELAAPLGGNVLIASRNGFYIADKSWNTTLLFDKLALSSLYINSLVVLNEHQIYLGMRGGYAQIDLPKKQLIFYRFSTE